MVQEPAPLISILEFNECGTRLVVRPFCHTDHYWQVYFDTNKAISEVFAEAACPVPAAHQIEHQHRVE